jgi:hypothetical protein
MSLSNKDGHATLEDIVINFQPTGNTHTVTAGSTTNVFTNTTFDGSKGSKAYTIGDIVAALKTLGVLAT